MRGLLRMVVIALGLAAAGQAAGAAERVTVRAGLHDGYGRLVFDWPSQVGYSAVVSGRMLTIRFDRDIDPAFGGAGTVLQPYLTSIARAADGRTIRAQLVDEFAVRSSTLGHRVVIDLLKTGTPSPDAADRNSAGGPQNPNGTPAVPPTRLGPRTGAAAAGKSLEPAQAAVPVKTRRHRDYGRLVFDWPRKVGFNVERRGQAVTIRFDVPATIDLDALRRDLPSQISAATARPSREGLEIGLVVPPEAQLRYFHNKASVVFDVVSPRENPSPAARPVQAARAVQAARPAQASKATSREDRRAGSGGGSEADKKTKPRTPPPFVSVEASQNGADSILKFNWRRPVAAAVFRRDESFWVVFDRPARIDLGPIHVIANGLFREARQHSDDRSAYLRLPMGPHLQASVRREGTVWVVEAGPDRKGAIRNLPLDTRSADGKGLELAIGARNPGSVIAFRDETVGDVVYAVPLAGTGAGIQPMRRFPEFELLHSAQGLAVRPLDDAVRVRTEKDAVVISKPGGLTISGDAIETAGRRPRGGEKLLLDLAAWQHGPPADYQKIRHELLQYVTEPNGIRRNAARLGLARFYVSHGLGAEAIGVLDVLLQEDAELLRDPAVRALRGLASYLVGHYADADRDFSHLSLAGIRELYPWRAGIAAARGDWAGAHQLFTDTDAVIAALPSRFAVDLGLLAAEAALSVEATDVAEARLLALGSLPAVGGQLDHLAYLRGHLLKQKGEIDKALELWQSVAEEGARPTRAKSTFAIVNTRLETGAIKTPEAIDRLEALKFAWRNSVFEFDLLNKLGQLYAEQQELRQALVTLRQAVTLYKDIKGAQALTKRMRAMFREFYLDGAADKLEPVVALGLYNEFRELTPTDEDGDRMIRKLAERLVAVDLLGEAAELLDHQVQYRLKDGQKADTGARLAEILLLYRKPQEALAALDRTGQKGLPAPLSERRRHLRGAALLDAKRYSEALKGIADDFGEEFDMLRAQIYWRAGDWLKASRALARLTGRLDPGKLGNRDAELLLRRAVALGLAGDRDGMQFLRERFGAAMEKSSEAAAFKAVAGGKLLRAEDYAALARRASELDTFRAFMKTLNRKPAAPKPPEQTAAIN